MPVSDRRLYLNNDRTKVVEEGDPDSGSLLAAEGDELTDEQVKQYGIKLGKVKAEEPAENKAETPDENKAEEPRGRRSG